MGNYLSYLAWLSPELVLIFTGLGVLIADLLVPESSRRQLVYTSLCGIGVAFVLDRLYITPMLVAVYRSEEMSRLGALGAFAAHGAPPLLYFGPFTTILKDLILVATGITAVIYCQQKKIGRFNLGEFLGLLLFSAAGMMFLVSSDDLLMVFLSMEFIGIISYILVGYIRQNPKAGEAAVKFFLIGAFSSAIMVYGMSFIFGLAGTTSITKIGILVSTGALEGSMLLRMGVLMLLVGLGFKLAMVPFHSWLPDAMEGSSAAVAGFISVAPKAAGLAVIIRVFGEAFPLSYALKAVAEGFPAGTVKLATGMLGTLSILAVATMTFGNLMALPQRNVKRLLAYSSIAHIGYILVGVISISTGTLGVEGVVVYVLAYVFMNLGAFACVIAVSNRIGSDDIEDYAGLSRRNLPIALLLVLFLLSLGGLPPTAGFIGKLMVFGAAIKSAQWVGANGSSLWASPFIWVALAGVLNSVVSIYYYMRLAYQMFFREPRENTGIEGSQMLWIGAGFSGAMILIVGLFPNSFILAARTAAQNLFIY